MRLVSSRQIVAQGLAYLLSSRQVVAQAAYLLSSRQVVAQAQTPTFLSSRTIVAEVVPQPYYDAFLAVS